MGIQDTIPNFSKHPFMMNYVKRNQVNIENVIEQQLAEAERKSISRERKHPYLRSDVASFVCMIGCVYCLFACVYIYMECMSARRTSWKKFNIKQKETSLLNFTWCMFRHGELHNKNTKERL